MEHVTTDARRGPRGRPAAILRAVLVAGWVATVAVPPVLFMGWRDARLAEISTPDAQADWERFRADMREQSGDRGPVRRKVPKSPEPPERVWLRDYPLVIVAAWVVFVGLLGGVVAILLRGAVAGSAPRHPVTGRG